MLRSGRVAPVIAALARACRLDERLARRVTLSRDHESIAILCRYTGFNRNEFATFFLLLNSTADGPGVLPPSEVVTILRFYDDLTAEVAGAVLRFWRRDAEFAAAVEQI